MWTFLINRHKNYLHLVLWITDVRFNSYELDKLIYRCLHSIKSDVLYRRLRSRLDALRNSSSQIKIKRAENLVVLNLKIRRAEKSSSLIQTRRVLLLSSDLDSDLIKLHRVEYFLVFLLSLVLLFVSLFSQRKEIFKFVYARKLIVLTLTLII
jgi:hypothetical protein